MTAGGWSAAVEQAYIRLGLDLPLEATLVAGRFNAPIGFESLDAPDMFQYSHALVFDYGLPVNFTGARLDLALPAELDLKLILANGWDNNTDADMEKTFAGRLGRPFGDFGIGFSWIADAEVNGDDSQLVLDVDATWVHGTWRVGVEYNMGTTTVADQDLGWSGLLLMCHKDFSDRLGLTLRYDSLRRQRQPAPGRNPGCGAHGHHHRPHLRAGREAGCRDRVPHGYGGREDLGRWRRCPDRCQQRPGFRVDLRVLASRYRDPLPPGWIVDCRPDTVCVRPVLLRGLVGGQGRGFEGVVSLRKNTPSNSRGSRAWISKP
jgi:hypothetical protein